MNEKINIETGDDSTNITGKNVYITNNNIQGLTEDKVTEIIDKKLEMLNSVQFFTQEAYLLAEKRVKRLEDIVVPRIAKIDETLKIFADPSFQATLKDAVKVASQTDDEENYKLLSELLAHKAEKNDEKTVKMDVTYAIDVVDKISDSALQGLTTFIAIQTWFPASGVILKGLNTINNLYSKLLVSELPIGDEWLDQLDILKVIRIQSFGKFSSLSELQKRLFSGYVVCGIPKDFENIAEIYRLLDECSIPRTCLIVNELDPEYLRLPIVHLNEINQLDYVDLNVPFINGQIQLNQKQIENINKIITFYDKDSKKLKEIENRFMEKWNTFPSLKKIGEWWSQLPCSFNVTSIGRVLSITNAQRIDNSLPKVTL